MPPPETNNPNMLPNGVMKPLDNSRVPVPTYPSTNTAPSYTNDFPAPSTTPSQPEMKWKPIEPLNSNSSTPLLDELSKLKTIPRDQPSTTTTTDSGIDIDKYIKH